MELMEKLTADLNRIVKSNMFWYGLSIGVSGYLSIAPLFQPEHWNAKRQLYGFGALAITLPLAAWTGRKVEHFVTELQVTNQMRHQYEIDDIVHAVNYKRAVNAKEIRLINGAHSMGELQEMMVEQMRIMGDTMKALRGGYIGQGQLPEAQEPSDGSFSLEMVKDSHKLHVLLVGATGSGKTTLAKYLAVELFGGQDLAVYDCDDDGKTWGSIPVYGQSDDFTEISGAMKADLAEFQQRSEDRIEGKPLDRMCVRIIEEMPSTLGEVKWSHEWLKTLLRRGRKRRMAVLGVAQERTVNELQCRDKDGKLQTISAKLLQNFTVLYLADEAFAALDRVRDKEQRALLRQTLQQCERPCLVEFNGQFYGWTVPDLSGWRMPDLGEQTRILRDLNQQDGSPVDWLNRILNLDAPQVPFDELTDEIKDELIGSRRSPKPALSKPAQTLLDKYTQKEMHGQLVDARWVQRNVRTKEFSSMTADAIRDLFRELKQSGHGVVTLDNGVVEWGILDVT